MPPAIGNIIRVTATWSTGGSGIQQNVIHWRVNALPGVPSDAGLMDALQTAYPLLYADVDNMMHNSIVGTTLTAKNLTQDLILPDRDNNVDGTVSAFQRLPLQVSAQPYFPTAKSKVVARTFLPTFTEDAVADGNFTSAALTLLASFAAGVLAGINQSSYQLSRQAYNVGTGVGTALSSSVIPFDTRTQRRRRFGVGA